MNTRNYSHNVVNDHAFVQFGDVYHNTIAGDSPDEKLLHALASNYQEDKNFNRVRVTDTCLWFFEDEKFLKWKNQTQSCLLWVSADPGCGKSVLSRCLIDEEMLSNEVSSSICYFFFKSGIEKRQRAADAMAALLHQLFVSPQGHRLIRHALEAHKEFGSQLRDMFDKQWDILLKAANEYNGEVVCLLDALDECEENTRKQLMDKLVRFCKEQKTQSSTSRLKFIVTSRPYYSIAEPMDRLTSFANFVHFKSDEQSTVNKISAEINLVIAALVPEVLRKLSIEVQNRMVAHFQQNAQRTYLWLHLTLDVVKERLYSHATEKKIVKLIAQLPLTVIEAYTLMLEKVLERDLARSLLQITVAAQKPLTVDEINVALAIGTQEAKSYSDLDLDPPEMFKDNVRQICGLFITVYDSKVYLLHQTAREFLMSKLQPNHLYEWYYFSEVSAHETLLKICFQTLELEDFQEIVPSSERMMEQSVGEFCESHPFVRYAAEHWTVHYRLLETHDESHDSRALALCDGTLSQGRLWLWLKDTRYRWLKSRGGKANRTTRLMNASGCGLTSIVRTLIADSADVNEATSAGETALTMACEKGYTDTVRVLLASTNTNMESLTWGVLLLAAARGGDEKIMAMLLAIPSVDVNAKDKYNSTALMCASQRGYPKIVRMLLSVPRINFNAKGSHGATALSKSSGAGHEEVVKMLLAMPEIDINSENSGESPLGLASKNGHDKSVRMLLDMPDITVQKGGLESPLSLACQNGHAEIVKMLLALPGMDVNQGTELTTLLGFASKSGHHEVVKILLTMPDVEINSACNPLLGALKGKHEAIANMLLDKGARPSELELILSLTGAFWTLAQRFLTDYEEITSAMLARGFSLLHCAAMTKSADAIAWALQEEGTHVDARDRLGWTPLYWAAYFGDETSVQALLDAGADRTLKDLQGWMPYRAALLVRRQKILEMLYTGDGPVPQLPKPLRGSAHLTACCEGCGMVSLFLRHASLSERPSNNMRSRYLYSLITTAQFASLHDFHFA